MGEPSGGMKRSGSVPHVLSDKELVWPPPGIRIEKVLLK